MRRRWIDAFVVQSLVGAAALAMLGRSVGAGHLVITGAAACLSRPFSGPRVYVAAFLGVLAAQAWLPEAFPALGRSNVWWDGAHFAVSAAATPIVLGLLTSYAPTGSDRAAQLTTVIAAVALTVFAGVVWELLEWRVDALTGMQLAKGYADTMHDLLADTIGALVGAAVITLEGGI